MNPPAEHALAEGFATRIGRWSRATGAPDEVVAAAAAAARDVSLATSEGHVCVRLLDTSVRAALLASGVVGTPVAGNPAAPGALPLILDDEGRLYLNRYFDYERRLAHRLLAPAPGPGSAAGDLRAQLDELFAANAARLGERTDWQKIATALALLNQFTIISGGPGTGKTTTVVSLLAAALARDPACRVRLAAPTGKAAARMLEAMRKAADQLDPALRARLPTEASTIHRLLGVASDAGTFRHHSGNPLALDLLVVDEASMLDLALATRLLEAVPQTARVVLLGDKDQLAAVEAGAVFAELAADPSLSPACVATLARLTGTPAARIVPGTPPTGDAFGDRVVWLTENFRFPADSGIGRLATHVKAGDVGGTVAALRDAGSSHVGQSRLDWLEDGSAALAPSTRQRMFDGYAEYVAVLRESDAGATSPARLFATLDRFRVVCALRDGPRGAAGINTLLERHVRGHVGRSGGAGPRSLWYPGRPVMVRANDYTLKLFNGDIGIVLPAGSPVAGADDDLRELRPARDDALAVWFPDGSGGYRAVTPLRLPPHETAFATTVHKAQGSEFDDVLVVLPAGPSRVVTRELVYTAITRARRGVTIVGSAEVLAAGVAAVTIRHSGLRARLREAGGDLARDLLRKA